VYDTVVAVQRASFVTLFAIASSLLLSAGPAIAAERVETLATLEQAVSADPENLKLAADYRQLAIAMRQFDRSIDLFEKLAKRKERGPNVLISLALAYVDKVPTVGDMGQLRLGRDAISILTKSIEERSTLLAYYTRGVINLYFNNFIFHRVPRGIADLQHALAMTTADTPPDVVARIYTSLGDGYWRLDQRDKAREVWTAGARRCPEYAPLETRTSPSQQKVAGAVRAALDARNRVDTRLRELFPGR